MAGVPEESGRGGHKRVEPHWDTAIARLARRQHGVVSLTQLRALGLSRSAVAKQAARGRLHRIYRGVYAVGHDRLTREGHWMAAVLGCGPHAVLSHRSAAALWGLRPDNRNLSDVSLPRRAVRSRAGITVHAAQSLTSADLTHHDGIPCTSVARTLLDLAAEVDERGTERAIARVEMLRLFDLRAVVLGRANGHRGAGGLAGVLDGWDDHGLTEDGVEERFFRACDAADLPRPTANERLVLPDREVKADFLWPAERLIVETDGRASHSTHAAFEDDRRRDQSLLLAGYRVVRFTWRQVAAEPARVAAVVRRLLYR